MKPNRDVSAMIAELREVSAFETDAGEIPEEIVLETIPSAVHQAKRLLGVIQWTSQKVLRTVSEDITPQMLQGEGEGILAKFLAEQKATVQHELLVFAISLAALRHLSVDRRVLPAIRTRIANGISTLAPDLNQVIEKHGERWTDISKRHGRGKDVVQRLDESGLSHQREYFDIIKLQMAIMLRVDSLLGSVLANLPDE